MPSLLALSLALVPSQEPVAGAAPVTVPLVTVPPGRVADVLAALPSDVRPARLERAWPAWSDRSPDGFGGEVAWRRWVELVRAEAAAATSAPERRAELAVLARLQGRDGDAWAHLVACARDPARVAALLPLFSPGVPLAELARAGPLPDGVLLTPALPPCDDARAGLRCLAGKRIERREFEVGAARLSLAVSVDRDGLEVALRHLAGGAVRVRVVPPLPRGVEPGPLLADWEKLPDHEGPVEFALDASQPEHSLWLTFRPPTERWPSPRLETLAAPGPGREIVLVSPRGDEPVLARFAEALSELLDAPAALRAEGFRPATPREPLVLHFGGGPSDERKLIELVGLAEAFALRAPNR